MGKATKIVSRNSGVGRQAVELDTCRRRTFN